MGVADILADCRARGVVVTVRGGRLHVAPRARLVDASGRDGLRQRLAAHAPEVIRLLSRADRVSALQEICPGCEALFVDVRGFGRCRDCYYATKAARRDDP
jgi:hypothetical protein